MKRHKVNSKLHWVEELMEDLNDGLLYKLNNNKNE